jgi:hypothetical protein
MNEIMYPLLMTSQQQYLANSSTQSTSSHGKSDKPEEVYYSRKGYNLKELAISFLQVLSESGHVATGKLFHYTADMICSGGFELWSKLCWEYAIEHIGIARPRIFVFLKKKFAELNDQHRKLSFEQFIYSPAIQQGTFEVVLILQMTPKKTKVKCPVVQPHTHGNDQWFDEATRSPELAVVRRAFVPSHDLPALFFASNELMTHITNGALEKALFWLKWIIEEDTYLRKKYGQGSGLSTHERGPPSLSTRQRTHPGYYLSALFAEAYKEFAEKYSLRLHEEFQTLLDLYRVPQHMLSNAKRTDLLILMVQILTEAPRWKIPASETIISDPVLVGRALSQSEIFYREILQLPLPARPLPTKVSVSLAKKKQVNEKEEQLNNHLSAIDNAIMNFYR